MKITTKIEIIKILNLKDIHNDYLIPCEYWDKIIEVFDGQILRVPYETIANYDFDYNIFSVNYFCQEVELIEENILFIEEAIDEIYKLLEYLDSVVDNTSELI